MTLFENITSKSMPSIRKSSHRKSKSHHRKRQSSTRHVSKRKNSAQHGGSRKSSTHRRSRVTQKGDHGTAKFWCMGCRKFSVSPIDRYEKGKSGGTFAKGRCKNCDTKVSLIVKSEEPVCAYR